MKNDQLCDFYSHEGETLLSFIERYERLEKTLPVNDMNLLNQTIQINKSNNESFRKSLRIIRIGDRSQILQNQRQKNQQSQSDNDRQQIVISDQQDNHQKIRILNKDNQCQSNSQQVVRKSKRLRDKGKRKQSSQPRRNYMSMIKKLEKQHKSEQAKQLNRPLIERLKNPGKATLRQINIMLKNNQFYYSINVKTQQYCKQHKPDKKCQQNIPQTQQQLFTQQSPQCMNCKKVGTYWFSSQQLQKYNNGNFIRKYLETFI